MTTPRSGAALDQGQERQIHPSDRRSSQQVDSMARMTLTLPRSLCRQVRLHALEQDTTLTSLLVRLIRTELGQS